MVVGTAAEEEDWRNQQCNWQEEIRKENIFQLGKMKAERQHGCFQETHQ